jgi:hypothetical protein
MREVREIEKPKAIESGSSPDYVERRGFPWTAIFWK